MFSSHSCFLSLQLTHIFLNHIFLVSGTLNLLSECSLFVLGYSLKSRFLGSFRDPQVHVKKVDHSIILKTQPFYYPQLLLWLNSTPIIFSFSLSHWSQGIHCVAVGQKLVWTILTQRVKAHAERHSVRWFCLSLQTLSRAVFGCVRGVCFPQN